jgi:hypothetical protein
VASAQVERPEAQAILGYFTAAVALIEISDVSYVDEQLAAIRQYDTQRVDDPVGQVKLTEDLNVDDFWVGDEKAA